MPRVVMIYGEIVDMGPASFGSGDTVHGISKMKCLQDVLSLQGARPRTSGIRATSRIASKGGRYLATAARIVSSAHLFLRSDVAERLAVLRFGNRL